MEIYLIRHTSVAISKTICYGQTNVALSNTFHKEFDLIKTKIPATFDAVYTSPLVRCTTLAKNIITKEYIQSPLLLEMNFGDWENQAWNDIDNADLQKWMLDFVNEKAPNGENLIEVNQRVILFMETLRKSDCKTAAIVTHAGVIRCICAYILAVPLQNIFKLSLDYGTIIKLSLGKDNSLDSLKFI